MCDKVLAVFNEFKDLIDSNLIFLEQNDYRDSEIAKKTLRVYKNYFATL